MVLSWGRHKSNVLKIMFFSFFSAILLGDCYAGVVIVDENRHLKSDEKMVSPMIDGVGKADEEMNIPIAPVAVDVVKNNNVNVVTVNHGDTSGNVSLYLKGGDMLKSDLESFLSSLGWKLIWRSKEDIVIANDAIFDGKNVTEVVSDLINTLRDEGVPFIASVYTGNSTVVVDSLSERDSVKE